MLGSRFSFLWAAILVCTITGLAVGADDAPKTKAVEIDSFTLNLPESWKQTDVTSQFRKAQFEIPAVEDDPEPAELVVYYFGPQGGGGVEANVQRWVGQFDPDGREVKATTGESEQGKYVVVDVTGTYNKPIGPPIRQQTKPMPGARMLGVILHVAKGGNYFFKLTGPEKTVAQAADAFRASFGAKADDEKEYE